MKKVSLDKSKRICRHMNEDHIESVKKYLIYYGKITDFKNAYLEEITSKFMKINYDGKYAIINFKNEISEDEIRSTLISMLKDI